MTETAKDTLRINVQRHSQVQQAATMARRFAETCGFPARAQWELATIVAELASNMVKHAGRGVLTLTFEPSGGMTVVALDKGTFIGDPKQAIQDGYSRGRMRNPRMYNPDADPPESHGAGLGAVWRLSDRLDIEVLEEGGTRVTAVKSMPGRSRKP